MHQIVPFVKEAAKTEPNLDYWIVLGTCISIMVLADDCRAPTR